MNSQKLKEKIIIFDLDGTLALIDHRRHFLEKNDWKSFFDNCHKDLPNTSVISLWNLFLKDGRLNDLYIFSGRCESVKDKTLFWLKNNLSCCFYDNIRMRPKGNSTPDDKLKELWLDEILSQGKEVEMVFDDRQKVVDMWRRRGITCFQVAKGDF